LDHEFEPHVVYIARWKAEKDMPIDGWRGWLRPMWDFDEGSVLIVDEAQTSYWDYDFWSHIKAMGPQSLYRIITFASYGSVGPNTFDPSAHYIVPIQSLGLRPFDHGDGVAVGLLLTRSELDDFAQKRNRGHRFDTSFFDCIFDLSNGHIGACEELMRVVCVHSVCPRHFDAVH
jgi:hypothetical protein